MPRNPVSKFNTIVVDERPVSDLHAFKGETSAGGFAVAALSVVLFPCHPELVLAQSFVTVSLECDLQLRTVKVSISIDIHLDVLDVELFLIILQVVSDNLLFDVFCEGAVILIRIEMRLLYLLKHAI